MNEKRGQKSFEAQVSASIPPVFRLPAGRFFFLRAQGLVCLALGMGGPDT
jgi:hypothetical protein